MEQRIEDFIVELVKHNRPIKLPDGRELVLSNAARQMSLIESYQERCGLVNYNHNTEENVYSSSGFYSGNDYIKHGLRGYLYEQFARYNIGEVFNLNIQDFLKQDFNEISLQIEIAKEQLQRDQVGVNEATKKVDALTKGLSS